MSRVPILLLLLRGPVDSMPFRLLLSAGFEQQKQLCTVRVCGGGNQSGRVQVLLRPDRRVSKCALESRRGRALVRRGRGGRSRKRRCHDGYHVGDRNIERPRRRRTSQELGSALWLPGAKFRDRGLSVERRLIGISGGDRLHTRLRARVSTAAFNLQALCCELLLPWRRHGSISLP